MQTVLRLLALTPLLLALGGCDSSSTSATGKLSGSRPQVALVSNGVAEFWTIAKAGAIVGAKECDVDCDVRMPGAGAGDQQRIVEDLLSRGVDGIAISPINSENQHQMINAACKRTILITHDSDAPKTDRLCYVGMNNYDAGRMVGKLVKEVIPNGGEIMLFIGRLGQLNADLRRQGVIDEVLDRSHDETRRDPQDPVLKNEKYIILGTRLDGGGLRPDRTKANAEDALINYPNIACMVGLFEYNPPAILEALAGAGKLDQIKVVGFDENRATLQAIRTGRVYSTVVQNPFEYGRQSVRILAGLARGDKSVLPEGGFLLVPARVINKTNVDQFEAELDANLARARGE